MDLLDRALDGRQEILIQQLVECGFSLHNAQRFLPALCNILRKSFETGDHSWKHQSEDTFTNLISYRINHHKLASDAGIQDEQAFAGLAVVIPDIIRSLQSGKLRLQ